MPNPMLMADELEKKKNTSPVLYNTDLIDRGIELMTSNLTMVYYC